MHPQNGRPRELSRGLVIATIGMLFIGFVLYTDLPLGHETATGEIVGYRYDYSTGQQSVVPIFGFTDPHTGIAYQSESDASFRTPPFEVGHRMPILYNPGNPAGAVSMSTSVWDDFGVSTLTLCIVGFGIAFYGATIASGWQVVHRTISRAMILGAAIAFLSGFSVFIFAFTISAWTSTLPYRVEAPNYTVILLVLVAVLAFAMKKFGILQRPYFKPSEWQERKRFAILNVVVAAPLMSAMLISALNEQYAITSTCALILCGFLFVELNLLENWGQRVTITTIATLVYQYLLWIFPRLYDNGPFWLWVGIALVGLWVFTLIWGRRRKA